LDARVGALDETTIRHLLTHANLDRAEVDAYVEEPADAHYRRCVIRRENYEVWVLTWSPTQGSVAHDRPGSLCGLKVVRGSLTEQLYEERPDGRVRRTTAKRLGAGEIIIDPGTVVHSLANSSPDEMLVTVHIYSLPLPEVRRYAVAESSAPGLFLRRAPVHARVIAIIGGGFTGLMAFANLLRFGDESAMAVHLVLIDRQSTVGEGVAYRTTDVRHLLNVSANRMSAWPDVPEDFLTFARSTNSSVGPYDFLPRRTYSEYVRKSMLDLAETAGDHLSAEVVRDEVSRVAPLPSSGWQIETTGGRTFRADSTILAVGHRPPDDPLTNCWTGPRSRFVTNPWDSLVMSQIGPHEPVILIGSGLTAIDVVLTLNRSDRVAPIMAISRHGLMPRAHLRQQQETADMSGLVGDLLDSAAKLTSSRMVSLLRQYVVAARESGVDWQQVIDALRPVTPRLWNRLVVEERSRFLRHVRPFWEVHRHRTAPAVADTVDRLRREKKLEVVAGTLIAAKADSEGIDVTFSCRGTSTCRTVRASWIVNCSGPGAHNSHGTHPFLQPLLEAGTLRNDELKLGLLTDVCGRAIGESGDPHPDLLVAGTLRKATLWESTAIPELRQQAQTVARIALASLLRQNPADLQGET
jgi:uncharacterized NAD(P)/FAD-binding protein YdhS